jgi:phosphate transport system protein
MPERDHTSTHYDVQLSLVKEKLLLMSSAAEQMISDSMRALVERRPSLAEEVIQRDDDVDKLELEIDDLCYELVAREQPVAGDLRFVMTALKIVKDIERIGDTAVNIAERAIELIREPELKPLIDLPVMAKEAQRILTESLDAFVDSDTQLAASVIQKDRILDNLYGQILRELLTYMLEDTRAISSAIKLIFIAKHLERVGDHSANIAEMVVFLVSGQDVRHQHRAASANTLSSN